jgi:cytochrome c oxidase assembly protein subunit 15
MDGRFFPAGYWGTPPHASGLFETIEAVQFNHRLGAYVVFALAIAFALAVWRQGGGVRRYGVIVAAAVTLQALVGIWTLVAAVPLWLGLIHQLGALGVLTVLVLLAYDVTPRAVSRAGSAAHPDSAPRAA